MGDRLFRFSHRLAEPPKPPGDPPPEPMGDPDLDPMDDPDSDPDEEPEPEPIGDPDENRDCRCSTPAIRRWRRSPGR